MIDPLPFASSSTTIPTPPRAVHDQENVCRTAPDSFTPRKARIVFSNTKEVFTYSPGLASRVADIAALGREPNKSILKPSRPLEHSTPMKTRDITPFPETPLDNAHYLMFPVETIVDESSTLRELTEAYSTLAARIRQSVPPDFFDDPTHDTRYRLFQPLCKHSELLTKSLERDLACVFVDPFDLRGSRQSENVICASARTSLPTPKQTPSPKKGGMNEEQVVYARDLHTTASAAVKLLTLVFQSPAIYESFSKSQLKRMLTASLSIPLAESLRSPCARKVCGFTITLLQSQRLPDDILSSSADRIAFALKRALVGELGREGKKGATGEALRAIHDLSLYKPAIFVPELAIYITAVVDLLVSPSSIMRVLAAHALGGYALAMADREHDFTELMSNLSPVIQNAFLEKEPADKTSVTLVHAIRIAFRSPLTVHAGQSPLWAVSVLASIIILIGPALLKDGVLIAQLKTLIQGGLCSTSKVRHATESLLGPLVWSWRKWRHSSHLYNADERRGSEEIEEVKSSFQKLLGLMTMSPVGTIFVGSLLGGSQESCQQQDRLHAIYHTGLMGDKGGYSTERALAILDRLVNAKEDDAFYTSWESKFVDKLTPPLLFSVAPGLLTVEAGDPLLKSFASVLPKVDDIRPLSSEERQMKQVWIRSRDAWMTCLRQLSLSADDPSPPPDVVDIWVGLVKMIFSDDKSMHPTVQDRSELCGTILADILADPKIDLREVNDDGIVDSVANKHLKLAIVSQFWTAAAEILPPLCLASAAKVVVRALVKTYMELVHEDDGCDDIMDLALSEWAALAATVDSSATDKVTLGCWNKWKVAERTRSRIWRAYARAWSETKNGSWKIAVFLLGLPFSGDDAWDMSDADNSVWNSTLTSAIDLAGRSGIAALEALEQVVKAIDRRHLSELSGTLRMTDHLVTALGKYAESCTVIPRNFTSLLKTVLETSYPPSNSNKVVSMWLLRSLQSVLSKFTASLAIEILETIQAGLCLWLSDDCAIFTDDEFSNDIMPLFQTTFLQLEALPVSSHVIQTLSPIIESAVRLDGEVVPSERKEAFQAFQEFWNGSCKNLRPPRVGWPEGLVKVLGCLSRPCSYGALAASTHLDSDDDELDVLPRTLTPRKRHANLLPLPPSPPTRVRASSTLAPPTTPVKATKTMAVAPRLPSLFGNLPSSPTQKRNVHRRTSSGCNHRRTSSKSHASEADKENEPPLPNLSSDDVIIHSKRALLDVDSTPIRAKRSRTESGETTSSDDSIADIQVVETMLTAEPRTRPAALPLGISMRNGTQQLDTPTKRAPALSFARSDMRTPFSSPTKRRKTQSPSSHALKKRSMSKIEDDDDYLPPSSDLESDDEGQPSSSSPVGPLTPAQRRKAEFLEIMARASEDEDFPALDSSPTRSIKRANYLSSGRPLAPLPPSPVF